MKINVLARFGTRIKELRLLKNISQEELGELAELHRTYIGMIERGERNITLKNIEKIAKAFDLNIEELFRGI